MVRNSTRGSDGDVGQEEELGRQPRVGGGHPTVSNKLAEPLVRRTGGPSSNGSQNWANGRSGNEVRIVSSKGGTNVGAKPVPRGSSSFVGSNRFDASKKNPDVSKPVVYIFRDRSTDPSRLSTIKTIKDHNGAGPIGTVSKILSNSNRKDHGGVISKTSKAALVEDRVGVTLDSCTSNRSNNPPSSKPSEGSSMANRSSTRATRSTSQLHGNDTGGIAKEQQRQQCTGLALCCNPKENNSVNKQENCASAQPISRHVKGPTIMDLHVVVGESSSSQPPDEAQTKFTPPQPPPEVRGRSPSQDYILQEWMQSPSSPTGQLVNVSDRPSLCMSVRGNEACIGSSDHALYIVDCEKCTVKRALYGKQYGHTEWVTCCDYLKDGRILSGGMDGKLCLWDKNGIRAIDLLGHMASISAVRAGAEGSLAVSASYDKTLMLWNVNRLQTKNAACLKGHKAPVLGFCLSSQGAIVSGSRDGDVILWDTAHATPLLHVTSAHEGHVTAVECLEDTKRKVWEECREMYLTGGQDGILRAWDFRTRGPVHSAVLHRNAVTKGAVNSIAVSYTACGGGPIVVTAGADNSMKVLEPRMGFKALHTICTHRNFIYSLYVAGPLAWSGSGDGSLLVHELLTGQCLYGLGADSKGAVRCISLASPDRLVVAGDDGNVMIYKVSSCDSENMLPTEHFQS